MGCLFSGSSITGAAQAMNVSAVLFFCQPMGFERNIQLTEGPETILKCLTLRNGLGGIFLSGQKQGADHGGD